MCGEKEKSKIEALQEYMNAVHKQALKKKKKTKGERSSVELKFKTAFQQSLLT